MSEWVKTPSLTLPLGEEEGTFHSFTHSLLHAFTP